jgi:hypothetical protein
VTKIRGETADPLITDFLELFQILPAAGLMGAALVLAMIC